MPYPPSLPPKAQRKPALPFSPSSSPEKGSVWIAWGIDLLIVLAGFISISLIWVMVWAMLRTAALTAKGGLVTPNGLGDMGVLSQMLMTIVAIGLPTLLVGVWRHWPTAAQWRASFQAFLRPATWGWVLLIAVSCLLFSRNVIWLGEKMGLSSASNVETLSQGWLNYPFVTLMMVVVLAPIYEEVLFRRILFRRLWQAGYPLLGMLLSGFLFAFVHEVPGTTNNGFFGTLLLWFVYTTMGVAFAWIYRHTGTLYAAIAAHSLNNAVALTALVWSLS